MTPDEALRAALEDAADAIEMISGEEDACDLYRAALLNALRSRGFVIVRESDLGQP